MSQGVFFDVQQNRHKIFETFEVISELGLNPAYAKSAT